MLLRSLNCQEKPCEHEQENDTYRKGDTGEATRDEEIGSDRENNARKPQQTAEETYRIDGPGFDCILAKVVGNSNEESNGKNRRANGPHLVGELYRASRLKRDSRHRIEQPNRLCERHAERVPNLGKRKTNEQY